MKIGDTRNSPGKLIDTWVYKVKDVELETLEYVPAKDREDEEEKTKVVKQRVVNKIVTIEIRMEKTTVNSEEPPHPLNKVSLVATCKELKIKIDGTDVEALRAAMWSKLDKEFEIKWERYFLVHVDREKVYSGSGTGLTVSYEDVYKGTTYDGKTLLRIWKYNEEKIKTWPGAFKDEMGKVMACIPATKENEEALDEFIRRTNLLREKMQEFLRPDRIEKTLADLGALKLLPA